QSKEDTEGGSQARSSHRARQLEDKDRAGPRTASVQPQIQPYEKKDSPHPLMI
ncbi:hypothetical protein ACLOJK_014306, partial [Asimina triloba]